MPTAISVTAKDSLPPIWSSNFLYGNSFWAKEVKWGDAYYGGNLRWGAASATDVATRVLTAQFTASDTLPLLSDIAAFGNVFLRTATDTLSSLTDVAFKTAYRTAIDLLPPFADLAGYLLFPAAALVPLLTAVGRYVNALVTTGGGITDLGIPTRQKVDATGVWLITKRSVVPGVNVHYSLSAMDSLGVSSFLSDIAHKNILRTALDSLPAITDLLSVVLVVATGKIALLTEKAAFIHGNLTEIGDWTNLNITAVGDWVKDKTTFNTKNYMEAADNLSLSDTASRTMGALRNAIDALPGLLDAALHTFLATVHDTLGAITDTARTGLGFLRTATDSFPSFSELISRLSHSKFILTEIFPSIIEGGSGSYTAPVAGVFTKHIGVVIKVMRRILKVETK